MKQFDLQTYLAHPEKKVVTRDGRPVRILGTDRIDKYGGGSIIALIKDNGVEYALYFHTDGMYYAGGTKESSYDLFFADEEPELTEFESAIESYIKAYTGIIQTASAAKQWAKELLERAKKELMAECENNGIDPTKDEHYYYWQGVDAGRAEALKEIEQDPESSYAFKRGVEYGKEDALKDLPRWKKADVDMRVVSRCIVNWDGEIDTSNFIPKDSYYIPVSNLEKLPGFKEE